MKMLKRFVAGIRLTGGLAVAVTLLGLTVPNSACADDRCYELRTYYANDGKLDALHARFRDHTMALFEKHGMSNIGYWVPVENPDNKLIYLMAYPSRAAREEMWKKFMDDPNWKIVYGASSADGKLESKVVSQFLSATPYSMEIKVKAEDPARLFELRTYTTIPGKFKDINARFRDHTIALFEKHGIRNIGYWELDKDQEGAGNTLIYLVAHKDEAGRRGAFRNFSQDPDWQAARKASEADGPILIPKGVVSLELKPTDYSPLK